MSKQHNYESGPGAVALNKLMYCEIDHGLDSIVPGVVSSDNHFKIVIVYICLIFSDLLILFIYLVFGFAKIGILFLNF